MSWEIIKNQKSILDSIAFEIDDLEEQPEEFMLFSLIRDFVVIGYFTSEIEIKDLVCIVNTSNKWDNISEQVLKDYEVKYD